MALEKFIRGKKDDAKHDGLRSNIRRLQSANDKLTEADEIEAAKQALANPSSHSERDLQYHYQTLLLYGLANYE